MSQPAAIHRFQDNEALEEARHGEAAGCVAGADAAAPCLASIQSRYEEAKASIADLARASAWPADDSDSHPDTQAIDLSTVTLPVVPGAVPATETMSVAARSIADRLVVEEMLARHTASSPAEPEPPTAGVHVGPPAAPRNRRRWWRGLLDVRLKD